MLDPATNKVTGQIAVGASPHHPLITATGEYGIVVSQGPGELAIWSPDANKITGTVKVGTMPHWIAASATATPHIVTNEMSNDLTIVDVENQKVIATVPVGNAPRKIVLQPGMIMRPPHRPRPAQQPLQPLHPQRHLRPHGGRQRSDDRKLCFRAAEHHRRTRPDRDMDEQGQHRAHRHRR